MAEANDLPSVLEHALYPKKGGERREYPLGPQT